MIQPTNPYDHLPASHLKRQLRKVSKRLTRIALKGGQVDEFEHQRILMLSLSDSLKRKNEVAWLESLETRTGTSEASETSQ